MTIPVVQLVDFNPIAFEVIKTVLDELVELRQYDILDRLMLAHEKLSVLEHNLPKARVLAKFGRWSECANLTSKELDKDRLEN